MFAVLTRGDRFDLVFAFAGNATPDSLREYSVGAAWAAHVEADGRVGEPYWRVDEEPPTFFPTRRDFFPQGLFDSASISKDGRRIVLAGVRIDEQGEATGGFELPYEFDARSGGFVARPLRRLPLKPGTAVPSR